MGQVNTTESSSDSTFRFLDLPLELQREVLAQYFGSWTITVAERNPQLSPIACSHEKLARKYFLDGVPSLSILRVNKHIHTEAKSLFWATFTGTVSCENIDYYDEWNAKDRLLIDKLLIEKLKGIDSRIITLKTSQRGPRAFQPKHGFRLPNLRTLDLGMPLFRCCSPLEAQITFMDFLAGDVDARVAKDFIGRLKDSCRLLGTQKPRVQGRPKPGDSLQKSFRKDILYKATLSLQISREWSDDEYFGRHFYELLNKSVYVNVEVTLEPASILVTRVLICTSVPPNSAVEGQKEFTTSPDLPRGIAAITDWKGNLTKWELPRRIHAPDFDIDRSASQVTSELILNGEYFQ